MTPRYVLGCDFSAPEYPDDRPWNTYVLMRRRGDGRSDYLNTWAGPDCRPPWWVVLGAWLGLIEVAAENTW